jgi:hypothetical protein
MQIWIDGHLQESKRVMCKKYELSEDSTNTAIARARKAEKESFVYKNHVISLVDPKTRKHELLLAPIPGKISRDLMDMNTRLNELEEIVRAIGTDVETWEGAMGRLQVAVDAIKKGAA